jgi:hypothetical protein
MASAGHCTTHAVLGNGAGVHTQGESMLELRLQLILNARRDVAEIYEQVRFIYGFEGVKPNEHIFDIVTVLTDKTVIAYAVKPEIRLKSGRFIQQMQEVSWWVRKLGFADDVRIITDADVHPVMLHNAEIFAALRGHHDPEAEEMAYRVVMNIPQGGAESLRALTFATGMAERGYRALLLLVRKRILEPVRDEKIGPKTLMRLSPTATTGPGSCLGVAITPMSLVHGS